MTKFEHAEDYPTTVLLIIDGWCDVLRIRHEHAFPCCRASFGCRDHQPDDEPAPHKAESRRRIGGQGWHAPSSPNGAKAPLDNNITFGPAIDDAAIVAKPRPIDQ